LKLILCYFLHNLFTSKFLRLHLANVSISCFTCIPKALYSEGKYFTLSSAHPEPQASTLKKNDTLWTLEPEGRPLYCCSGR